MPSLPREALATHVENWKTLSSGSLARERQVEPKLDDREIFVTHLPSKASTEAWEAQIGT